MLVSKIGIDDSLVCIYHIDTYKKYQKLFLEHCQKYPPSHLDPESKELVHYYQSDSGRVDIHKDKYLLSLFDLPELNNLFLELGKDFYTHQPIETNTVSDAWLNLCFQGGSQFFHPHLNAKVSGTWFLNYPEQSAPLGFKSRDNIIHIQPNEGDLLLWDSKLEHGYSFNQANNRLSLSFNLN